MAKAIARRIDPAAADFARRILHERKTGEVLPPEPQRAPARVPKLTATNVPRFIGAVARAMDRGTVTPQEAKALLYAAQVMLSAMPKVDTSSAAANVLRRQNL